VKIKGVMQQYVVVMCWSKVDLHCSSVVPRRSGIVYLQRHYNTLVN